MIKRNDIVPLAHVEGFSLLSVGCIHEKAGV